MIDLSSIQIDQLRPVLENMARRINDLERSQETTHGWLDTIPRRFATDSTVGVKTASFTPESEVEWFRVNATSGAITVTLPLAADYPYRTIGVIKTDSSANAATLSRSGSDTFNGDTTVILNYQYQNVILKSDGISAWDIKSIPNESFSWTPVLTCVTPGDLAVSYTTQVGNGQKTGREVRLSFTIITSSFTHTTASGNLRITGSPDNMLNVTGHTHTGALEVSGLTKTGYTNYVTRITAAASNSIINLFASGSGVASSQITIADFPTGGAVILRGSLTYPATL